MANGRTRIRRWKVLGVAIRRGNIGLAMRAFGLGRQRRGIPRVHLPQTTRARRQGLLPKIGRFNR